MSIMFFLVTTTCISDVIIAVDNSACFRDHWNKMMHFVKTLVIRIGKKASTIHYGARATRLALMKVSGVLILLKGFLRFFSTKPTNEGVHKLKLKQKLQEKKGGV